MSLFLPRFLSLQSDKPEIDVINIICQRDCDPISFPRRKEIVSPVKERTPKGDCDVPPLETPFVSAAVRGIEPERRLRRVKRW